MNASMQVLEIALEVLLVFCPGQAVDSRRSVFLKLEECPTEQIGADVVQERGELLLLPFLCYSPYAFQRL
jgi:hypothetical protein